MPTALIDGHNTCLRQESLLLGGAFVVRNAVFFWYPLHQFILGVEIRPLSTLPDVPIYDFVGEPLLC